MSKHNAYLKDENLLTLFSLNNLIVPEIQREYVWGLNPKVLEKFLREIKDKAALCEHCRHAHTTANINVGFLYSYKPPYVKYESERILDEYLIDGQQRITTLFLLLLYRATIECRIDEFITLCRADEYAPEMGFNYKVRSLTQQFLVQLIQHARSEGASAFQFVSDLDNAPYWFLDDYRHDPTVTSMVAALAAITRVFDDADSYYFDYLLTNIHFWHFKTEATSQGEELYITMNSRGEQLADNEMQKSRTLPSDKLLEYGRQWEEWQTFFWRNRSKGVNTPNPNADKGFNNYLACIENLEHFTGSTPQDTPIDIDTIAIYMKGLMHICSPQFKDTLTSTYQGLYTGWFDHFLAYLWQEVNGYDGKWDLIDPRGGDPSLRSDYQNKSVVRNKTMLLWSWMTYFKKLTGQSIDDELLIRILHLYYIRYRCYKRSTTSIVAIIDAFIASNGTIHSGDLSASDEEDDKNSKAFSEEEIHLSRLCHASGSYSREVEAHIWAVQELPDFVDGEGVGGNTVYESFRDKAIIAPDQPLRSIQAFHSNIRPLLNDDNKILIKRILLFYKSDNKAFWSLQSPSYYYNYETSLWKRIVRTPHFIDFYKEYTLSGQSLEEFLAAKRKAFFSAPDLTIDRSSKPWSHRRLAILYDLLTDGQLWDDSHPNIAFWPYKPAEVPQTTPTESTEIFIGQDTLWKGKRYYDGDAQIELPSDWRDRLKDIGVTVS